MENEKGINTHVYTSSEIIRVAKVAFELAQKEIKKLHLVKNQMLWKQVYFGEKKFKK